MKMLMNFGALIQRKPKNKKHIRRRCNHEDAENMDNRGEPKKNELARYGSGERA